MLLCARSAAVLRHSLIYLVATVSFPNSRRSTSAGNVHTNTHIKVAIDAVGQRWMACTYVAKHIGMYIYVCVCVGVYACMSALLCLLNLYENVSLACYASIKNTHVK